MHCGKLTTLHTCTLSVCFASSNLISDVGVISVEYLCLLRLALFHFPCKQVMYTSIQTTMGCRLCQNIDDKNTRFGGI